MKHAASGSARWWWLPVAAVIVWSYGYGIGSYPLKWEEPRRCIVAMEMIESGNYITPTVLGEPYLKKPPLQNWMLTLLAGGELTQVDPLRLRLISLMSLAGIALFVWRLGGVLPLAVVLTMGVVVQSARAGEIDPLFVFFVVAALAWVELGRRRGSPWLQWCLPQLFVGAGVLTKVVAPLFFYPPVLFWAWRRRAEVRFAPLPFAVGLALMAGLVATWLVPYAALRPAGDLANRWMQEAVMRVDRGVADWVLHLVSYPLLLVLWMLPWSIGAVAQPARAVQRIGQAIRCDPWMSLCWTFVCWAVIVFLFVPEHRGRYLLPAVPFLAVLLGPLLEREGPPRHARLWPWLVVAVGWVAAALLLGPDLAGSLAGSLVPAAVGLVAIAGAALAAGRWPGSALATGVLAAGLLYIVTFGGFLEAREARSGEPNRRAAIEIAAAIGDDPRPVVCPRYVDLEFAAELARRIGRPLRREARDHPSAFWIRATGQRRRPYELQEVQGVQGWSQLGRPLVRQVLRDDVRMEREAALAAAQEALAVAPDDADRWIWVGRRTAYLGDYRGAIDLYSEALASFPDDPRLWRHRGHRYVSIRRFDLAVADLTTAARLMAGRADEIEPDGMPNAAGVPTSTLAGNIHYHLGLARYLRGELALAAASYRQALELATTDDSRVAARYWLYLSLRRLGQDDRAREVLEPIDEKMQILENHAYRELLLLFRGEREFERLIESTPDAGAIEGATLGYGIAAWQLLEGRRDEAIDRLWRVLDTGQWPAFGYIAAEVDLARIRDHLL